MTSPTGCTGPTPSKTPVCPDSTLRTIHSAMSRASMTCTRSSGDPGPRTGPAIGLGQPLGPVRVAPRRVAGADDQPGPDHHRPRGAVEHQSLAGDLHAAVRLRVLAQVAVLLDRLDQRAVGAGVRRLVVAVDVHRRDEHPVRGGQAATAFRTCDGMRDDVDDGVELLARELGGYVVGAVPDHVPRPVGNVARPAARHARDLVPARHRVRRRRLGEEHAAAEHQDPHADTRPCRPPQGQAVPLRADSRPPVS